jgi:N-methylhydantoinase B
LGRLFDVLGGLLGQGNPAFLNAAGFSDSPHFMYSGYDKKGEWYQLYQIGFGGVPGRPFGDGPDGHSMWPSFTNVPNEFVESYFPLRIETYETIADSGGAGKHRGGNALRVGYRFLEDGEISIHDDRWLTYPWGVNGGTPGKRSRKELIRKDRTRTILPSKCDRIPVKEGDLLYFDTWGGGGWGDPYERPAERVAFDVEAGLVTVAGARGKYGVVLKKDMTVDDKATSALRSKLAKKRGKTQVFNFGGTIPELKKRCKAETGLPAPVQPEFPRWVKTSKQPAKTKRSRAA